MPVFDRNNDKFFGNSAPWLLILKTTIEVVIKKAVTRDEKIVSEMAQKNAKQALTEKILETESNSKLIDNLADKFNLNFNVNLIEVYDNSHVQGSDAVGALITFGKEGFVKKRYRKFNIKSDAVKGDDYGMMKEVLNRRFVRALKDENTNIKFKYFKELKL